MALVPAVDVNTAMCQHACKRTNVAFMVVDNAVRL